MSVLIVSANSDFRTYTFICHLHVFGCFWPPSGIFYNNMHGKELLRWRHWYCWQYRSE